jgi:hypothetical protein
MDITVPEGLIRPEVQLVGEDGNAFMIIGRVTKALRKAGNPKEVIDSFTSQATAGDYTHLLAVAMEFADVS